MAKLKCRDCHYFSRGSVEKPGMTCKSPRVRLMSDTVSVRAAQARRDENLCGAEGHDWVEKGTALGQRIVNWCIYTLKSFV